MRAINHTVTGALLGAVIGNPVIALPAALLSHLVLDAIPHSGGGKGSHTTTWFKLELAVDAALSASFLLTIALLQLPQWPLLVACGILGAAPDLWWLPYWIWELQGRPRKFDPIGRFLARIQWYERPWGYGVELVWLVGSLYLFLMVTAP